MILSEIIRIIEAEYPTELAYEWDNVGLLAGSPERDVKKAVLTLDITPSVVDEAVDFGADLIISHHPLIFSGIKNFSETDAKNKMYAKIIRNNICVYSAHTNMDTARRGINQYLAELFELDNTEPIDKKTGLGRVGNIKKITLFEFANTVKARLNTPFLRISGNPEKEIKRVSIGSGACSELIPDSILLGADVLLTADVKYHTAIDAVSDGIAIIDAGHYPTEVVVIDMLRQLLKNTGILLKNSKNTDIFTII